MFEQFPIVAGSRRYSPVVAAALSSEDMEALL